jgi:hypothetical protein
VRTIIDTDSVSVHLWGDDANAVLTEVGLYFNGVLVDTALTTENAQIKDCGVPPEDWYGRKYIFTDSEWVENPNDPILP